jgi:two-component system, NarL family, response regulator NreC
MHSSEVIRVVLVDEHALVRAGLRALLSHAPDMVVVAESGDAFDAATLARQTKAQVLILDRAIGGENGSTVARLLHTSECTARVLALTTVAAQSALDSLLLAGVGGYLTRGAVERDLADAVRVVARGGVYRCPVLTHVRHTELPATGVVDDDRRRFDSLTPREREVLVSTANGFSAPEIGVRLQISPKTVDTYKQRIHEKLGLHHRAEYVRLALRLGLLASS